MKEILIIGNKPYSKLNMNKILDSYEEENIFRCNMSLPGYNNGTKFGTLILCNHIYEQLILKFNRTKFLSFYDQIFKDEYMEEFLDRFSKHCYKEILECDPKTIEYNKKLKDLGCPYFFSQRPRTGYAVMFESILSGHKPYISNFSIHREPRETYYVIKKDNVSPCHSEDDELNIINWLHKNGVIDATLCLLEDKKVLTFCPPGDAVPVLLTVKRIERCYNQK